MPQLNYSYATGDRIKDRNTYFYTPSVGQEMLQAWLESRAQALEELPTPAEAAPRPNGNITEPASNPQTLDLETSLERLWARVCSGKVDDDSERFLLKLVHKFETVKRFHRTYDERFLAEDKSLSRDFGLYVRAGELMLCAFVSTRQMPYLNVLQKIIDTLCSVRAELQPADGARLARLIRMEHVEILQLIDEG